MEGLFEVIVEGSVDDWIDERVEVPQPGEHIKEHRMKPTVFTDPHHQRKHEEWEPAYYKRT